MRGLWFLGTPTLFACRLGSTAFGFLSGRLAFPQRLGAFLFRLAWWGRLLLFILLTALLLLDFFQERFDFVL